MFQYVSPECVFLFALTVSSLSFAHLSDDVCKANRTSADAYHLSICSDGNSNHGHQNGDSLLRFARFKGYSSHALTLHSSLSVAAHQRAFHVDLIRKKSNKEKQS